MSTVFVPPEVTELQPWVDAGVLGPAEVHAAAVVAGLADGLGPEELLAFALALRAPLHGHSCVDLGTVADIVADEIAMARADDGSPDPGVPVAALPWPDPPRWEASLRFSPAVRAVDGFDHDPVLDDRPLVLFGTRLYTQRQWTDECSIARSLRRRAAAAGTVDPAAEELLRDLLPDGGDGRPSAQRLAATAALSTPLTVILGGPGTGKTHAVACLLAALATTDGVRIGLAAPTGKAAARLTETIAGVAADSRERGTLPAEVADRLSAIEAVTVHRLLGPRPDHRSRFHHHPGNPLPFDVVAVDECSMLALPLTARLLEAVPDECRLVLVGDPDQLTSIEVGAVLGDITAASEQSGSPLSGTAIRLQQQHRTGEGAIGRLREAVRRGDAEAALRCLRAGDPALRFVELADGELGAAAMSAVRDLATPPYEAAQRAAGDGDASEALAAVATIRVLCAHRRGQFGVEDWNVEIERWLAAPSDHAGRVLLATRNDFRTGIANGETGVLVRRGGRVRVAFARGDAIRELDPAELDDLDTAFAMTVHKSQGSEFDDVAVIHPPADSPLIARELLYTAITRARRRLLVVASPESIRGAVETPTRRVTGLADALTDAATSE